jgi:hypothetical protein
MIKHWMQNEEERQELDLLVEQLREKVEEEESRREVVEQSSEPNEDWLLGTNVNQTEVR